MARTYNKNRSGNTNTISEKSTQTPQTVSVAAEKAAPVVKKVSEPVKKTAPAKSVIAAPDNKVMQQIVYQPSAQILTREVGPNESFGVGDDMPIYYL